MDKIKEKLKYKKGFTMTELLVSTIIMMLATGLITSTLDLAIRQFHKSTTNSNAQLLCSTLANYVTSELAYATVHVSSDEDGADVTTFDSDVHNMGIGASFTTSQDGAVGRLVETSPSYSLKNEDVPYYDIAGPVAYANSGGG